MQHLLIATEACFVMKKKLIIFFESQLYGMVKIKASEKGEMGEKALETFSDKFLIRTLSA
jgi:hypothetical protein